MAQGLFNLKQVMQGIQQGDGFGQRPPVVEYLVVAGGGGAGSYGAGGAGGLLQGIDPVPNGQTLLVTVGGGGSGSDKGVVGSNSVFGSITSNGGGGGGGSGGGHTASSGGSGGGGGVAVLANTVPGQGVGGQGNRGGYATIGNTTYYPGGGGGGAGTVGLDGSVSGANAGNGGAGIASAISGTVTTYAGGGGGGAWTSAGGSVGGAGGTGGGGNGGSVTTTGTAGTANTGGGGGGLGSGGLAGYNGGSGIVILSYPDTYAAPTSTTGSPTVSTSGSGSLSFNGSSQFVGYANNAALQLTGDFTIEGWFYLSSSTGINQVVISKWNGANGYLIYYNAAQNKFYFQNNTVSVASSTTQSYAQYYHVAVTKSGNNYVLYVNGTSVGTATSATTPTDSSGQLEVGRNTDGSSNWVNGYISNVRIVKGTAVYTSNFTPSTTPLTAVSGTSLLLNTVSGAPYADGSTNSFATTTATSSVGPWNASSPFTVTGYKNRVYTWTSSGSITF